MHMKKQHSSNATHRVGLRALQIACVALLSLMVGCASTHRQEGTGEYLDDSVITGKVKAAVFNEPGLKSSEINVETFKGAVQMSGYVTSQADINKAVALARDVDGVTTVRNSMTVKGQQ
jgi:osmotically-inducible protein OsmY